MIKFSIGCRYTRNIFSQNKIAYCILSIINGRANANIGLISICGNPFTQTVLYYTVRLYNSLSASATFRVCYISSQGKTET